ncbi:MAG: fasciclin domain-containing protein [Candidatus Promineifilaceae bacterium]
MVICVFLPACGDLGTLGEEMAATRDAARPTPLIVETDGQEETASSEAAPLIIELAKPTLQQAISVYPEVSRAVAVLESAEFGQLLLPDQQYTIFVPTNDAFAVNSDVLENALLTDVGAKSMWHYLVVPQPVLVAQFSNTTLPTMHGSPLPINVTDGVPFVSNAAIVRRDVEFDLGIIHIIDRTILPQ